MKERKMARDSSLDSLLHFRIHNACEESEISAEEKQPSIVCCYDSLPGLLLSLSPRALDGD